MTMLRAIQVATVVASIGVAGCGGSSDDVQTEMQSQEQPPKTEAVRPNATTDTPVAEMYQAALTKLLKIRKSRENLSYSVAAKVGEEMAAFRSLSLSNQVRKLKELEKQLEDYE